MAQNTNTAPLQVGKLPKECYTNWQEFADDLAKVISFPQDTKQIIQGAKGDTGATGRRGPQGETGPPGTNTTLTPRAIPIPAGVKYVSLPIFTNWEYSIFTIKYNGRFAPVSAVDPFDPDDGYIGVGTIVVEDGIPTPTTIRVYFVFSPGITVTPDDNFILQITTLS